MNDNLVFPFLKDSLDSAKDLTKFENGLVDRKIVSINRHGKYFWLRFDDECVLLMHFGMTGMIKLKNVHSHLTFMENGGDKKILKKQANAKHELVLEKEKVKIEEAIGLEENAENGRFKVEEDAFDVSSTNDDEKPDWPPKFGKLTMSLSKDNHTAELVFVDPRRLARIRYLTGPDYATDNDLFNQPPLNLLGPDYSKPLTIPKVIPEFGDIDPHQHGKQILNIEQFQKLILTKRKPIKSLLLDQAYFAGVGNWVADEIIYQSRLFPQEIISSKLPLQEEIYPIIQTLYDKLIYVCLEAVKVEGDVNKFPSDWLMLFRWGKARKKGPKQTTTDGYEVDHITIGGRTSCYVPQLQKPLKSLKIESEKKIVKNTKKQPKKESTEEETIKPRVKRQRKA